MSTKRDRLTVRIFRIVEGEAEGTTFAITVFLVIVLVAIGVAAWGLRH